MTDISGTIHIGRLILSFLSHMEEKLLSLLLLIMIILSCSRIVFRLFGFGGFLWTDPLLRYLVLWSGFLGAAMATSRGKHISLDMIGYLLPSGVQSWTAVVNHLFSTVISGLLTWAALLFIISEKEFGTAVLLTLPSYYWNLIFPISFALMTLRFFCKTILTIQSIVRNEPLPESSRL